VRACEKCKALCADHFRRGFDSRVSPGMSESFLGSECVSCGACVQACRPPTLTEKSVIEIAARAFRGDDLRLLRRRLAFKAECAARKSCAWCRTRTQANRGHSCVKGRFAWGYTTHKERILNPMIREKITDAPGAKCRGMRRLPTPPPIQAYPDQIRSRFRGRHHFIALHQRKKPIWCRS